MSGKPLDCVGIDPAGSDVGKHDFRPMPTEPIIHGPGRISPVAIERTAEARERYYSEKITELAITQQELGRVARERDALVRVVHLAGAMAGHPKDANEGCRNICKLVRDTKDKLASGELRKPVV